MDYLENGSLKRISRDLENFYSLRHRFSFSLNFDREANFLSFLSGIQMHINEDGVDNNFEDCGTGLQSLTIMAFHRLIAKLRHQNIILGLEEPETNLHPQAQRELIATIKNEYEKNSVTQILITTHSTVLIDNIPHNNICLVRKVSDLTRGFKSNIHKISESFFHDHGIPEFNYYQFHSYRNSDFFYANYVIFVESKNDAEVVKILAEKVNLDLDAYGVSIVNIDGTSNLSYPFYIVKDLKIPYLVILDKDFFIPYLNQELDKSRDKNGLPKYKFEYRENKLIHELIAKNDRVDILKYFNENHSKSLDLLINNNVICMNYCLEMDLLCSAKAVQEMCDLLGVQGDDRNLQFLLTQKNKAIKKIDNITKVVKKLEIRNLPNSYKKIKNELIQICKRS